MPLPEPLEPAAPELREREQRMRSLQRLAGRVAHDFNNYLSPIFGYLSLIKDETGPESLAHQYAVTMERGARRTTQVLDAILLAARPERRFLPSTCRLGEVLERCLQQWQAALPAGACLEVRRSIAPCRVSADEALWSEAIRQVLDNARFALSQGGVLEIVLEAKEWSAEEAAQIGVRQRQGVWLTFQDNGCGMSEATRLHAWEPFLSTRPKNRAPGLGLSMVYAIVRLHGGQVFLESREGEGTRTTLWVPSLAEESSGEAPPPNPLTNPVARLLLVDSDPMALETATAALQQRRCQVQSAGDTAAALQLVTKHAHLFSAAILSLHLPEAGSLELARQLRAARADLPLLFLSGDPAAEASLAAAGLAAPWDLLTRPFKTADLVARLWQRLPPTAGGTNPGA